MWDSKQGFTELAADLKAQGVNRIFAVGLAFEYCVLDTVLNGAVLEFKSHLLLDATRASPIPFDAKKNITDKMEKAGAKMMSVNQLDFKTTNKGVATDVSKTSSVATPVTRVRTN